MDYFVQLSVIQPGLLNGETDGLALLTQYNPHGIFIALEDLGYLIMAISFLFFGLAFARDNRLDKAIRWIFLIGFALCLISFFVVSFLYGINQEYIFECIVIVTTWIVLIINGILISIVFKRAMKKMPVD